MPRIPTSNMRPGAPRITGLPYDDGQSANQSYTSQAVQRLLQSNRERLWREREAEAQRAVQARAIEANRDGDFVPEEEGLAPRYQEAYRRTAETVYKTKLNNEAVTAAQGFAEKAPYDPDAFAQEWAQYTAGQLEAAEGLSPDTAFEIEQGLGEIGAKVRQGIAEQAQARATRVEELEFSRQLQETETTFARYLTATGDEERYYDAVEQQESQIAAAVESGLWTVEEGESARLQVRERLTEEMARGQFGVALRNGDIGQAKAVIRQLRAGKWYDDLDDGRALADQLASDLEDRLGGVAGQRGISVASANDFLRRQATVAEAGRPVDFKDPQYQQNLNFVLANGTERQRQQAAQFVNEAAIHSDQTPMIGGMTVGELDEYRGSVLDTGQQQAGISSGAISSLTNLIDKRKLAIKEAKKQGDWMSLAPDLPADASPEQRRAAMARVRRIAVSEGADPNDVPYFSNSDIATFNTRIAEQGNNPEQLEDTMNLLLAPARNMVEQQGLARRMTNPTAKARVALGASLGANPAAQLSQQSIQGRGLDDTTRKTVGGLDQDDIQELGLLVKADTIAGGDAETRAAVVDTMTNAYWALAADAYATNGEDADAAHDAAKQTIGRMLEPVQPVELANGARVPQSMLDGTSAGAEAVRDEINTTLQTHPAFEQYRMDPNLYGRIAPIPLENGEIGFVSRNFPRDPITFVNEQGEKEVLRVNREEVAYEGRSIRDAEIAAQRRRDASSGLVQLGKKLESAMGTASLASRVKGAERVAGATNGDARLDAAVMVAMEQTPAAAIGSRNVHTGLGPEWAQMVERDQSYESAVRQVSDVRIGSMGVSGVGRQTPDALTNVTGSIVGGSLTLKRLRDRYGDIDQALAAYWMGPGALEEVLTQAKEDGAPWEARVPNDAMQFVERVREEYGRE